MSNIPVVFGKRENASLQTTVPKLPPRPIVHSGAERRVSPRRKMLKVCKIIFNNHQSVFDGVMVNLSDSGAKLKVTNPSYIAKEFLLTVVFGNAEYYCAVRWRADEFIGVEFEN